jgi:uncharacterized delta-60 repeat protein
VSRWCMPFLALCCLGLALAPSALAKGELDRSFGTDGVVDLGADLTGGRVLGPIAVAPDGDIFVAEDQLSCRRGGCPYSSWLKRYRPDGTLDRGFDPGPGPVARGTLYGASLIVDSAGRPVLFWGTKGRSVVIRRLKRSGQVDRSFGNAGTVTLNCACYVDSVGATPDGGLLVAAEHPLEKGHTASSYKGSIWIFVRLRPDGSRDPRFGRDGLVRLRMPGYGGATATLAPEGTAILTGKRCCGERSPTLPFVSRLSRRGRLDRSFAAAARRSLRGVPGTKIENFGWEGITPIFRSHGRLDVYAGTWTQTVSVRLRRDGSRDSSFGHDGVSQIPLKFGDTASDGAGGAFVVGYRRSGYQVRRVRPDGSLDPAFGQVRLEGAYNEEGLSIFSQGRGRAIVLARDESVCRQVCPSNPKMFRVVDAAKGAESQSPLRP